MSKFLVFSLLVLLPFTLGTYLEQPEDVCKSKCVQKLYVDYCGGAECVHGTRTAEELEAMCSDECLNALYGEPLRKCLKKDLPRGADVYDFQDFLMSRINGNSPSFRTLFTCVLAFCFPEPPKTMESEIAEMFEDFELEDKEDP